MSAIALRPYAPGDETSVMALFERGFGYPLSEAMWRHKYAASPWADPTLSQVGVLDGAIVAHLGVVPLPLNVLGATRRAGAVADFVIDKPVRARGLDIPLFDAAHAAMLARRIAVGLSFPNELSVAPLQDRAPRVAMLDKVRLLPGSPAHAALRARVLSQPEIELGFDPTYTLDARYDDLWFSFRKMESLAVAKDRKYLDWKYLKHPENRYTMMALTYGDTMVAVCVCTERRRGLAVLEVIAREKSVDLARELLLRVADHTGLELRFTGWDSWFFREVFADFERRPAYSHHVFARATDPTQAFLYENAINWTLTAGDSESV